PIPDALTYFFSSAWTSISVATRFAPSFLKCTTTCLPLCVASPATPPRAPVTLVLSLYSNFCSAPAVGLIVSIFAVASMLESSPRAVWAWGLAWAEGAWGAPGDGWPGAPGDGRG